MNWPVLEEKTVCGASAMEGDGAAKNVVKEGAELAAEQLAKHADDLTYAAEGVVDVAKTTPTPPTQLVDDITAKTPVPGTGTPKAPNAPPVKTPRDVPPGHTLDCGCVTQHPAGVYDETKMSGQGPFIDHYDAGILDQPSPFTIADETTKLANRNEAMKGFPLRSGSARDEKPLAMSADRGTGRPIVRYPNPKATDIWCWATPHSIDVYTMTQDQSDDAERLVRVLRGTGIQGLGDLVFDGNLELTTGILAVGSELGAPPPEDRQLSLGVGTVALKIFTAKAVQTAKAGTPDEYPLSGSTEVTVLLHPNT